MQNTRGVSFFDDAAAAAGATMTKQSYEMIEGQVGGGGLGAAAAAGGEGESGSLLSSSATPLHNKGRVAVVVGSLLAVALLAGCVSASPRVSARGAGTECGWSLCERTRWALTAVLDC